MDNYSLVFTVIFLSQVQTLQTSVCSALPFPILPSYRPFSPPSLIIIIINEYYLGAVKSKNC